MRGRPVRKAWQVVTRVVGPDEALCLVGLGLVTCGAWPVLGQAALVLPGVVVVWLTIPSRRPFVSHPPERRQER